MSSQAKFRRVTALLAALAVAASAAVGVGEPFPQLAVTGAPAAELPATLGKVVVVDFWASWCAPCKASFPALARLQSELSAQGVLVVGVGLDDRPEEFARFVARLKPSFPVIHDREHRLARLVDVPAMPATMLLDRSGRVRHVHRGFRGRETELEMRRQIGSLLAETR